MFGGMPNNAGTPDLSKLDKNYQILTELHAAAGVQTYLARHLRLNRDVTIAVTQMLADDNNALTHFAADARLLTGMRHPNVIPVIEGIWLDERTFAVVRARVRGSTVERAIAAGPVPIERVATTIKQVESAIGWARSNGVVHRNVTARSIVFQQGNGRVLVSLEPRPLAADAMPDECDDVRTIGRIASEMLSGQMEDEPPRSATIIPPRIMPAVAEALEAVRLCDKTSASASLAALLVALDSSGDRPQPVSGERFAEREVPIVAAPADTAANTVAGTGPVHVFDRVDPIDRLVVPRAATRSEVLPEPAVVAAPTSFGFNARLGSAIAVLGIVGVLAIAVFRHHDAAVVTTSLAGGDTTRQAAGEVAATTPRVDPAAPIVVPPPPVQKQQQAGIPPAATRSADSRVRQSNKTAMPTRDSASMSERATTRDTSATSATASCASPDVDDQHECLMAAIERNDRELNSVFAKLVAALRRQVSAASSDPDPDTVDELRVAQRKWLEARDAACRQVGEKPFYARERSSCFAQQSSDRVGELKKMLNEVPPF